MSGDPSGSITLIDEDGNERRFTMHDAFQLDGVAYYLVEAVDRSDEVLLLRESDAGLETVDGAEFARVMGALDRDEVE